MKPAAVKRGKPVVVYYVSENVNPEKEANEIDYLCGVGRVVVVSDPSFQCPVKGVKVLRLRPLQPWMSRALLIWSKACFVLGRLGDSKSDREFATRNVYSGNAIVRNLVNGLWRLKLVPALNALLPRYGSLYFLPFRLVMPFVRKPARRREAAAPLRVLVHDSLPLRIAKAAAFIAAARERGALRLANVKSWDNPFYSQFDAGADAYLVWSPAMWRDVIKVHAIGGKPAVHPWGARPFFNYRQYVVGKPVAWTTRERAPGERFTIGYAAAFCDELMGRHELNVLRNVATLLRTELPQAVILFRPYPIIPASFYADLTAVGNVELVEIAGPVDAYKSGTAVYEYRRGSDEERVGFLSLCDCFLSMATSFTFEAAVFGLPIVHYAIPPAARRDEAEQEIFLRLDISEHLYYLGENLVVAEDRFRLLDVFKSVLSGDVSITARNDQLLRAIGIPARGDDWPSAPTELRENLLALSALQRP